MTGRDDQGFVPAVRLMRSEEERRDQLLAWNRSDEAFFAAGACHILAFRFRERYPDSGCSLVSIRPRAGLPGSHVYVSSDRWAFDFNGWTPESVLLSETTDACRELWPGWSCDLVVLSGTLEEFCHHNHHRLPDEYAFDPTGRADRFLDQFSPRPPATPLTE